MTKARVDSNCAAVRVVVHIADFDMIVCLSLHAISQAEKLADLAANFAGVAWPENII
jgi:hypothetical protein